MRSKARTPDPLPNEMAANKECTDYEVDRLEESFRRVASDLSMIADRDFEILSVKSERVQKRPAGRGPAVRAGLDSGARPQQ